MLEASRSPRPACRLDNVAIEVGTHTGGSHGLTAASSRGSLPHPCSRLTGVATWVVEHNEPVHRDETTTRGQYSAEDSAAGSLIVVPLRGRMGAIGVMTIERLGTGNTFEPEEFDLVKLFAGQVSIALQDAEVFRAVEIRAQTDDLTGLLNHGTFMEYLTGSADGSPFGCHAGPRHVREITTAAATIRRTGTAPVAGGAVRAGRARTASSDGGDESPCLLHSRPRGAAVAERRGLRQGLAQLVVDRVASFRRRRDSAEC